MEGTLLAYLYLHAKEQPHAPALRVKRLGIWQKTSWQRLLDRTLSLAGGLWALGLREGEVLAILGHNAPEWVEAELAAQTIGALPMGIYADAMPEEVGYFLEFTGAKGIVVADEEQLDKVYPHLHLLDFVLVWEEAGMSRHFQGKVRRFSQALGDRKVGEEALKKRRPEETALLAPTSGTTGRSKLAMLSHENLLTGHYALRQALGFQKGAWVFSYLPLPWIGEQMLTVVQGLVEGSTVHFPEDPATLREDLKEVQPDFFLAPPRLWEDMASLIQSRMADADLFKASFYRLGMGALLEGASREFRGERVGFWLNLKRAIFYPLIARPLRARLGLGACRIAVTGGAPLGPEVFTFFRALGLDIRQVYGQSETAAATTAHATGDAPPETVGPPLPHTEVRISEEGEIQVKGPQVFQGYFRQEKATQESFTEDGFFRTGDAGFFDERGHLVILGRVKEVGALLDGTRFAPQFLENRLKYSPYIREAVVLGHGKPFVSALIELDPENVQNWARKRGIPFTTYLSLTERPEVKALIAEEIRMVNKTLPDKLKIQRFAILPKELHPDDEEITRTRKVRRQVVEARYGPVIQALYGEGGRVEVVLPIRYLEGEGRLEATLEVQEV
ncbi:MAG: AMP-binding protein [Thermus sp.]|nr:AMP-binding protein [Thermus sp.]